MTDFDEAACLAVDPFDGDFGSPGDRVFRDKICTCIVSPKGCIWCEGTVEVGTRYRSVVAKFDGELRTYRYCTHCCAAMAVSETDGGEAWENRLQLRDSST